MAMHKNIKQTLREGNQNNNSGDEPTMNQHKCENKLSNQFYNYTF